MSENTSPFDKDWSNPVDEVVAEWKERTEQLEYLAEEFERIREVTDADEVQFTPDDVHFKGDVIRLTYRWGEDDE